MSHFLLFSYLKIVLPIYLALYILVFNLLDSYNNYKIKSVIIEWFLKEFKARSQSLEFVAFLEVLIF